MNTPGKTPQEEAIRLATVQLRSAIQPRETKRRIAAEAKVAELEGVIAKMKGLSPSKGGKPSASAAPAKPKGFLDALKEL